MGFFIVIEGGDGTGKTTQTNLLKDGLKKKGFSVFVSKEPGGPEYAEAIRKVILDPAFKGKVCSRAEMFLYMASRAQHTEEWIVPKMKEFDFYISSRYALSSVAYQGYARGLLKEVKTCNSIATQNIVPDLTIVLHIPKGRGVDKVEISEFGEKDRLELESSEFHADLADGFLKEAVLDPEKIKVIDYIENNAQAMHEKILGNVLKLVEKKN